jgi:hypothetical protein
MFFCKKRVAREQQKTLDVDYDRIENQFQEMFATKSTTNITSPTSTMVDTITQVPNAIKS